MLPIFGLSLIALYWGGTFAWKYFHLKRHTEEVVSAMKQYHIESSIVSVLVFAFFLHPTITQQVSDPCCSTLLVCSWANWASQTPTDILPLSYLVDLPNVHLPRTIPRRILPCPRSWCSLFHGRTLHLDDWRGVVPIDCIRTCHSSGRLVLVVSHATQVTRTVSP